MRRSSEDQLIQLALAYERNLKLEKVDPKPYRVKTAKALLVNMKELAKSKTLKNNIDRMLEPLVIHDMIAPSYYFHHPP